MPANTAASLQKVVVFATDQLNNSTCQFELEQHFPQAQVTVVNSHQAAWLFTSQAGAPIDWTHAITWLRQHQFDVAVILTPPGQSPYTLGYLCYLAGIPIRIGHSQEFGGQVLSHDWYEFWEEVGRRQKAEGRRQKAEGRRREF
jgi:hypothetical protein